MIFALAGLAAPALQLHLSADHFTVHAGTIPKLEAMVTNQSRETAYLVRKLDGSEDRMRFPHIYPEVKTDTGWLHVGIGRCGNTNNLAAEDFFELSGGKSWNAGEFYWGRFESYFAKPGVVSLRVVFDTTSTDYEQWKGFMGLIDPETQAILKKKLAKVTRVKIVSNPVEIRVIPTPL